MLRAFRLWLSQFNPIAVWREERRLDREAQLQMVSDFCEALRVQSSIAIKALDMSQRFLKSFEVSGQPDSYVVREDDEVRSAALRAGLNPEDFTPEDNPYTFV